MRRLLGAALVLVAAPAAAQETEIAVLGGYTTAGGIEAQAPTIEDLQIDGGFAWGVQAGHFFNAHLGFEASWIRQESAVGFAQGADRVELFDVHLDQVLGSVAYRFGSGEARLRPFVFAGAGASFFSATDLESETKLAWTVGAGLKWSPSNRVGARLQAGYNPTYLNDSEADFCDPFGFCQGWLHQLQFLGGVVVAF
jgi:opacity protein-like surface antigen